MYFTTKVNGQGIGLATTYSIIKKHKGYIEAESEINKGSTFTFYLPASFEQINFEKKIYEISKIKKLKILVLEDDDNIIKLLLKFFQKYMHDIKFTKNGNETINEYKTAFDLSEKYDLVILDLNIPYGMGGKDTFLKLKEIDPDIAAVVSSGYSNDAVIADYKNYGFKAYLVKPYTIDEISKIINDIFNINKY